MKLLLWMVSALQMLVLSGRDCKSRPAHTAFQQTKKEEHPEQREKEKAEFKIEVYDLVGRIVKTQVLRNVQNGNITIDLGQCLGVYIVRVSSDGETVFKSKAICLSH